MSGTGPPTSGLLLIGYFKGWTRSERSPGGLPFRWAYDLSASGNAVGSPYRTFIVACPHPSLVVPCCRFRADVREASLATRSRFPPLTSRNGKQRRGSGPQPQHHDEQRHRQRRDQRRERRRLRPRCRRRRRRQLGPPLRRGPHGRGRRSRCPAFRTRVRPRRCRVSPAAQEIERDQCIETGAAGKADGSKDKNVRSVPGGGSGSSDPGPDRRSA